MELINEHFFDRDELFSSSKIFRLDNGLLYMISYYYNGNKFNSYTISSDAVLYYLYSSYHSDSTPDYYQFYL